MLISTGDRTLEAYSKRDKMKVILLENPEQHRSEVSREPRSIWEHIEGAVRFGRKGSGRKEI